MVQVPCPAVHVGSRLQWPVDLRRVLQGFGNLKAGAANAIDKDKLVEALQCHWQQEDCSPGGVRTKVEER